VTRIQSQLQQPAEGPGIAIPVLRLCEGVSIKIQRRRRRNKKVQPVIQKQIKKETRKPYHYKDKAMILAFFKLKINGISLLYSRINELVLFNKITKHYKAHNSNVRSEIFKLKYLKTAFV